MRVRVRLTRTSRQAVASSGTKADAYTGVVQAFLKVRRVQAAPSFRSDCVLMRRAASPQIYREEGLRAFWKGNGTNVIRVAPYAAAQLSSNDFYKRLLSGARPGGHLCCLLFLTALRRRRRAWPPVGGRPAHVRRSRGHDGHGADAPAGALRCVLLAFYVC